MESRSVDDRSIIREVVFACGHTRRMAIAFRRPLKASEKDQVIAEMAESPCLVCRDKEALKANGEANGTV